MSRGNFWLELGNFGQERQRNRELGRHDEAVAAGRKAVELNPGFSILHGWLAAPLAKLGRLEEAQASAARLLTLDPQFSISRWSAMAGIAPSINGEIADGLRLAGLPE